MKRVIMAGRMTNHRRQLPPEREKDFLQAVRDLARLYGWMDYHTHDSRHCTPGFPDLVLLKPPRMIVAELKSERGILTEAQAQWIRHFSCIVGVLTVVWRPSDWNAIEAVLRGGEA